MDRIADFFAQRTARRALVLVLFLGVLYTFQHLAILFLFFVTFERALDWCITHLSARTGISRKKALLATLANIIAVIALVAWLGIGKSIRTFTAMHESYPENLARLRENGLVEKLQDQFGGMDRIVEMAKHYAGHVMTAASELGHIVLYVVMALILAVVWLLEEHEIKTFWAKIERKSIPGTLGHWFGHLADAVVVTVQLQFVVAACNTIMTLPVMFLIGVPNKGALMILIFVSALVPVLGNIISGTVLSLLAYQAKGWLGVGVFAVLTFVLHKIESYYLSPRLTARHVKMPGFLLIVSLILCEHLFGFKGLFLSFPILFVAGRIRKDFIEDEHGEAASVIDHSDDVSIMPRGDRLPISASGVELAMQPRHPDADPIIDRSE